MLSRIIRNNGVSRFVRGVMGKGNPISELLISRNIKSDLQHYKRNITINLDYLDLSSLN